MTTKTKAAKWRVPDPGSVQAKMLAAVDRHSYANSDEGKKEKNTLDEIAANSLPMAKGGSDYPEEWIIQMCTWVAKKRQGGTMLPLSALVGAIKNSNNRQKFLSEWSRNGKSPRTETPSNEGF